MCFSAEVDLAAAVVVGAVGIDALRHVRRPAELPLAVLPTVFAVHQLVEAFVWWGLQGDVPQPVGRAATGVYLSVAFGLLPVLVPLAVGALEPVANRRRIAVLTGLGLVVSAALLSALVRGPVVAAVQGHHIDYRADLWHGGVLTAFYVVATCGSLLVSAHEHVRWYGRVNLVVVVVLALVSQRAFISLWCAWAALTSMAIAVHLRYVEAPETATAG